MSAVWFVSVRIPTVFSNLLAKHMWKCPKADRADCESLLGTQQSAGASEREGWAERQVAERTLGASAPSFSAIGRGLVREQGVIGLWRGVAPRVVNVALWVRPLPPEGCFFQTRWVSIRASIKQIQTQ